MTHDPYLDPPRARRLGCAGLIVATLAVAAVLLAIEALR